MKELLIKVLLIVLALPAWALQTQKKDMDFIYSDIVVPKSSEDMRLSYTMVPIDEYQRERKGSEARLAAFNLFSDFRPVETIMPDGRDDLAIFELQSSFAILKQWDQIDLSQVGALQFLSAVDAETDYKKEDQINQIFNQHIQRSKKERIEALELGLHNDVIGQQLFEETKAVVEAQALQNGQQLWCQSPEEVCFSAYMGFPVDWLVFIESAKAAGQIDADFPSGIQFYGQLELLAQDEMGPQLEKLVSRIPYPAEAVLVQSSFGFERFIQYAKNIISFHPVKLPHVEFTLVVMQSFVAVEADALTKYNSGNVKVEKVFLSESPALNRSYGFARGLPEASKFIAENLKEVLERK